jgi:PPP family 3-phenylpropionic acid transporter
MSGNPEEDNVPSLGRKAMFDSLRSTTLTRFILLYAAMYAAFGVASPFLPAFVSARGLPPEQLGLVFGAGTAVRLLTAPLAGRIGDLIQALRIVLVVYTALAASVTLGYLAAHGFWNLLAVSLLHAASLAPITVLADALALGSASPPPSTTGGASSMDGCAAPARLPSSSALCCRGRRWAHSAST